MATSILLSLTDLKICRRDRSRTYAGITVLFDPKSKVTYEDDDRPELFVLQLIQIRNLL